MRDSMRRIKALVKKELKDFMKNANVFIICFLPLLFTFIFSSLGSEFEEAMGKAQILNMGVGMNLTLVSTFAISMLIAEEKEKNTLRTLMLSSVKPFEFLAGKAIVILLFSIVTNTVMYFIVGIEVAYLGHFILWSFLTMLTMTVLGGVIGLIAQNQMSTGVVGMPILILFFLLPVFAPLNKVFEKIALFLPNYNFQVLFDKITQDGYTNSFYNILTILVWILLSVIIFAYTYNKKGLDK